MDITTTGRTVIGDNLPQGNYLVSITGTWGGTSATLDMGNLAGDTWEPTQQEIGTDFAMVEDSTFVVVLPFGDLSVNLTGGAGIALTAKVSKLS